MAGYIKLKKSNCKNCYKCIRNCPVKSISFSGDQAKILEDECILCGMCFANCPQNAKEIRNDLGNARALINSGFPVYASVAPSFVANYDNVNMATMRNALKKLGFKDAGETAIGATAVKTEYDKIVNEAKQEVVISTCCHTINLLIQKHFTEAIPYLAKVQSPMQVHCQKLKDEHKDAKTIFIGPCISKKAEAEEYEGIVDCVLTFEELSQWMEEENVEFQNVPDDDNSGKARMFPTSGGILKTMLCDNDDYNYMAVDGMSSCIHVIKDIVEGNIRKCFIEMSACPGSCVGGPAMHREHRAPVRDYISINKYAKAANGTDFDISSLEKKDISKNLTFLGVHKDIAGSKTIEEILKKMGKQKKEDELNCGSCGYDTCRLKAQAVFEGKADLSMCLPFLKDKAETFSDNIINNTPNGILILNEDMEVQQINSAARKIMNVRQASDVIGESVVRILEPFDFIEVLSNGRDIHDKRIYLAEYKKYVEETIIYDRSYHILMCLMRDITDEEIAKEKKDEIGRHTMEVTDKVIEKQMRIVQEIASLLGETAAETKIALTNLKESLKDE
ncbi:MAG: [Fe-Fe] hydrogenase large subunit C-terminal domain-containing protein [Oscillospiraceae bacterium]